MDVGTLISVEEYLHTSYHPDRDFIEGEVLERNEGKRRHSYAQAQVAIWFGRRTELPCLQSLTELRMRVGQNRIRIPDVVVCEVPLPEEEVFTSPPYLCIEVMSPDDTIAAMQDRLEDYLQFGVPNVWMIDPGNTGVGASRLMAEQPRLMASCTPPIRGLRCLWLTFCCPECASSFNRFRRATDSCLQPILNTGI
ncbi:MAG TPA: Uma2 family endonuclease [Bryobacteraceae bacterium]